MSTLEFFLITSEYQVNSLIKKKKNNNNGRFVFASFIITLNVYITLR